MNFIQNSNERYVMEDIIYVQSVCNIQDNGQNLSLRIDFKDCNDSIHLNGERKEKFLRLWNERALGKFDLNHIKF